VKAVSAGVRVAILFILVALGGYVVWKNLGQDPAGDDNYYLIAKFRDASGLPKGSKVVIAGLPKGEVTELEVDGRYAKITFKLDSSVRVWESGVVVKKAASLLGDNYLEIDPGEPKQQQPDGTQKAFRELGPTCPTYNDPDEAKADPCKRIPNVVEATTPDQLLHRIEQTVPRVELVLDSVRNLSEDLRRIVNQPLASIAGRIDTLVQKESDTVARIIQRADRSMEKIEAIANDLRRITKAGEPKIDSILKNLDEASAEAKDLVTSARKEIEDTGKSLRGKLDKLDGVIDNTTSITHKIDTETGTLGKLVNDPAIAENIEAITDEGRDFLGTLFGLKAYVGLRSEFNFKSALARHYVSIELHTRPDKFYLIELEKGPRGNYPIVTLQFDPTVDPNNWIRKTIIEDKVRFTFQFAKRFGWATLRYGIKESTGGVGFDATTTWLNRRFNLSLDLFDATFDQLPRVKITGAFEMFRNVYILGGIDELLNDPGELSIITGNDPSGIPIQFEKLHYGRDYFLGAMLRFNDEDLAALLTVAGSAVGSAAQ
jgi:phospholipid/cholesterol/gamma-HCH transport system substrate-binding protein